MPSADALGADREIRDAILSLLAAAMDKTKAQLISDINLSPGGLTKRDSFENPKRLFDDGQILTATDV